MPTAFRSAAQASLLAISLGWVHWPQSAAASSYPPGDNMPLLVQQDGALRVTFECLDYQPDDRRLQCGRVTSGEDPGDCYELALDAHGAPYGPRRKIDCRARYVQAPVSRAAQRLLWENRKALDRTAFVAERDEVWSLLPERMWLRHYTADRVTEHPANTGGWQIHPVRQAAALPEAIAVLGRLCQGTFRPGSLGIPECAAASGDWRGSFGVMLLDKDGAEPARVAALGDPASVMLADLTSSPVEAGGLVFVGWGKDGALVLDSVAPDGTTCEWSLPLPSLLPYPIELLAAGDRLLATFSRDGRVSIVSVDTATWAASCGQRGVTVHEIEPIAAPMPARS